MSLRLPILSPETLTARVEEMVARKGPPPWSEVVVATDYARGILICQAPGTENDYHYHHEGEWWFIVAGELTWWFEDDPNPHHVQAGDIVFAPKDRWHHIEVRGDQPSLRFAVSHPQEFHRYDRPGCRPVQRR
ncbi:MAG: cupin domain-containing protein [Chloroflexi bacterium]|nr:cupin domain-containing protein [Chloroflexota bacterium]